MKLNQSDMAELKSKMNALKIIDSKGLSTELGRFALMTSRDMKKIAPVDTGNMKGLIYAYAKGKTAIVESNAPYSGFVEFSGNKPRRTGQIPFFYPTINRNVKKLIERINNKIKKAF